MNRPSNVVLFSGGLDSTVLLADCLQREGGVVAVNFNYGSKHNARERLSARRICGMLGVDLFEYDLPISGVLIPSDIGDCYSNSPLLGGSDLLKSGGDIPEGHYTAENMKSTVVPFRNGIMISLAVGYAASIGANHVCIANHAGDHTIYPDCRGNFICTMSDAVLLGTDKEVDIHAPFTNMRKEDIVKWGKNIGAPMHLSWSCYKGGDRPCFKCGTCVERTEAFMLAGIKDLALSDDEWEEAKSYVPVKR